MPHCTAAGLTHGPRTWLLNLSILVYGQRRTICASVPSPPVRLLGRTGDGACTWLTWPDAGALAPVVDSGPFCLLGTEPSAGLYHTEPSFENNPKSQFVPNHQKLRRGAPRRHVIWANRGKSGSWRSGVHEQGGPANKLRFGVVGGGGDSRATAG